jgi:exodeoxyribonuclease-3
VNDHRDTLKILTVNVGNPSLQRAERQLEWLAGRPDDILVLTETNTSRGCDLLADRLAGVGWDVRFLRPPEGERGVLVASRVRLDPRGEDLVDYLPARAEMATVAGGLAEIIGVYVPSRDGSLTKTERKQTFLDALSRAIGHSATPSGVLIGDLNVLEPEHRPHYPWFQDWEYDFYNDLLAAGWIDAYRLVQPSAMDHSWVGHGGDGYRYDHAFVSADLAQRVAGCVYLHETRELELTDHSAMALELNIAGAEHLEVNPFLSSEQPALF